MKPSDILSKIHSNCVVKDTARRVPTCALINPLRSELLVPLFFYEK